MILKNGIFLFRKETIILRNGVVILKKGAGILKCDPLRGAWEGVTWMPGSTPRRREARPGHSEAAR